MYTIMRYGLVVLILFIKSYLYIVYLVTFYVFGVCILLVLASIVN
jgi:hypothetical protein